MSDLTTRASRAERALEDFVSELDAKAVHVRGAQAIRDALAAMPMVRRELHEREHDTEDPWGNQR